MSKRRVLFVHDGPLYYDKSANFYYGIHYNDKLIDRYLFLGNHVTFIMRLKQISTFEAKQYSKINSSGFAFIEIPDFKSIKSYYLNIFKAKKIIETAVNEHDLIVARLPSAAGSIAFNIAKKLKKPVLVEFVACVFDALWNYDWRGKLLAHYKLYAYKKLMKNSSHTIYVTKQFLQSRYPAKGYSIGCSDVEISSLDYSVLEKRLSKIEQNRHPFVIGTVAAVDVPYKGQADVIRAIGVLKKQGVLFKYKLVGQGNPLQLIKTIEKNQVGDLVDIIGAMAHNEVFKFLDEIDLYIQPSKQEGLPRSLIEAMSKACPALGTNVAGIPELLQTECIFKPGNINQIIRKLKAVNPNWMKKQARINFDAVKEYHKDELANKRNAFYKRFLLDWGLSV